MAMAKGGLLTSPAAASAVGLLSLPPPLAHPARQPLVVAALIALVTAVNPAMDGLGPSTAAGPLQRLAAALPAGTSTKPPRRSRSTRI